MNLFLLHADLTKSAQYHCDNHVVKMPLKALQIAVAACAVTKITYANHPITLWAKESLINFSYIVAYGLALCKEYTFRFNKKHSCEIRLQSFANQLSKDFTNPKTFKLCIPDWLCKTHDTDCLQDAVYYYREYYLHCKTSIASWTNRQPPDWWPGKNFPSGKLYCPFSVKTLKHPQFTLLKASEDITSEKFEYTKVKAKSILSAKILAFWQNLIAKEQNLDIIRMFIYAQCGKKPTLATLKKWKESEDFAIKIVKYIEKKKASQ